MGSKKNLACNRFAIILFLRALFKNSIGVSQATLSDRMFLGGCQFKVRIFNLLFHNTKTSFLGPALPCPVSFLFDD